MDRPEGKKVVAKISGVDILSSKDYVPSLTADPVGRPIIHDRPITDNEWLQGWVEADDNLAHEFHDTPPAGDA